MALKAKRIETHPAAPPNPTLKHQFFLHTFQVKFFNEILMRPTYYPKAIILKADTFLNRNYVLGTHYSDEPIFLITKHTPHINFTDH